MRYVWLTYFLILLILNVQIVWPLQGEPVSGGHFRYGDNYALARMSKVCLFLAETCSKCTELKACFWCSNGDSITSQGRCYARSDLFAKHKCARRVLLYWERPCQEAPHNIYSSRDSERSVLIKLLLLLRKLHDSQNNPTRSTYSIQRKTQENQHRKLMHINLGDISNKDLRNKIVMLSNSSSPINNTTIENIVHNVSKLIESEKENSTLLHHRKHKVARLNTTTAHTLNTTVPSHHMRNTTTVASTQAGSSKLVLCHVYNQSTCGRNNAPCMWCSNNATCCTWEMQRELKGKIIVNGVSKISINQTSPLLCTARTSCQTCVADISCYWCLEEDSCFSYPGVSYVADECRGASHHKTCSKEMPVYVIALCIILITFFVSVGYLCVRKCYYFQLKPVEVKLEERPILFKQKNGRTVYQITESEEEDEEDANDSYTPSKVGAAPNQPAIW